MKGYAAFHLTCFQIQHSSRVFNKNEIQSTDLPFEVTLKLVAFLLWLSCVLLWPITWILASFCVCFILSIPEMKRRNNRGKLGNSQRLWFCLCCLSDLLWELLNCVGRSCSNIFTGALHRTEVLPYQSLEDPLLQFTIQMSIAPMIVKLSWSTRNKRS